MLANSLRSATKESKFLRQQLKIMNSKIVHKPSNSFAIALASDTSTLDGFGATVVIRDEAHENKNRKVENILKSGMAQQKNDLLATISTAGLNLNVSLYEAYLLTDLILQGKEQCCGRIRTKRSIA